jgi:hypothetical protein
MTNSTYASVSFAAESTKNVDVSAYGFNAQYCKVEVLDSNTSYKTEDFEVTRPSSTIITLTAGVSLTGTFRILITEVTH